MVALYNHNSYMPIGNAVAKVQEWQAQGANIIYCTSRKGKQAEKMKLLLDRFGFTGAFLVAREKKEKYSDIVEIVVPDILIEDDCKSIGGAWQMCIPKVQPQIRNRIISVVVPEFKGIDSLPNEIETLKRHI